MTNKKTIWKMILKGLAVLLICGTSSLYGAQASLVWNEPSTLIDGSPLTGLLGYRVHYGTASGTYNSMIQAGPTNSITISNLQDGVTYYFAVKAFTASGESPFSPELVWTAPTWASGKLQLSLAACRVNEDEGQLTISVTRQEGSDGAASINYGTVNGTAKVGLDYADSRGTLAWGDGDIEAKTIQVPILDDSVYEGNETFGVVLSGATGAGAGAAVLATVTILENELLPQPDFRVEILSLSPPDPAMGQLFDAVVKVINYGDRAGSAGYLSVWSDHFGAAAPNELASKRVSAGKLNPGQEKTIKITGLRAPALAGEYTLRAYVDSASRVAERVEDNNQATRTYEAKAPYVNLEVLDVDVAPIWPVTGAAMTVYVTVRNGGNVKSATTWLGVWSNKTDEAVAGELAARRVYVPALRAGEIRRVTVTGLRAPAEAGDYTLRAFVDAYGLTAESTEVDNQDTLAYTVYPPTPNFVVSKVTFSTTRPRVGQLFVATVTVRNTGTGAGTVGRLAMYENRIEAPVVGAEDADLYIDSTQVILPGRYATLKVSGLTASAEGPIRVMAFADAIGSATELCETDNYLSAVATVQP